MMDHLFYTLVLKRMKEKRKVIELDKEIQQQRRHVSTLHLLLLSTSFSCYVQRQINFDRFIEKGDSSRNKNTSTTNVQNSSDVLVGFVGDDFYDAEDTYDDSALDGLAGGEGN